MNKYEASVRQRAAGVADYASGVLADSQRGAAVWRLERLSMVLYINKILEEKKLMKELPEDLIALMKRSIYIRKHLESNHKDMTAKRGLQLTDSKINRLIKYYKKAKKIPVEWKFDPSKLKMYIE